MSFPVFKTKLLSRGMRSLCVAGLLAGSALGMNVQAAVPVAFSYDGESFAGESLPPAVQQAVYEAELKEAQGRRLLVNQYVVNRYIQELAETEGVSPQTIQQRYFDISEPTPEQIQAFYEQNKDRIRAPLEQVRPQIAQLMQNQALANKQTMLLAEIANKKGYKLRIAEPEAPVFDIATEGYPSKGAADAAITLVEFADYQCPHCKDAVAVVKRILERYPDSVRVVYRDFPVNSSGISRKVAEAAACADEQDKFWDFHALAFERQDFLKAIKPTQLAEEAGLDMEAFQRCYADAETAERVAESLAEAEYLGLTGTPTFFVNGVKVLSEGDLEAALVSYIERAQAQ